MKNLKTFFFLIAVAFIYSFSVVKEIPVKVVINNPQNLEFNGGKLFIPELKKTIPISKAENFELQLEPGKYQFKFTSNTPNYISFPNKITKENNFIIITLTDRKASTSTEAKFADDKNFENLLKARKLNFIHFGFVSRENPEFTKKYGIGIANDGCSITPDLSEKATLNNQLIAKYLTKNYGETWKKDLGFLPFGL